MGSGRPCAGNSLLTSALLACTPLQGEAHARSVPVRAPRGYLPPEALLESPMLRRPGLSVVIEALPERPGFGALSNTHASRPGWSWSFEEGDELQMIQVAVPAP